MQELSDGSRTDARRPCQRTSLTTVVPLSDESPRPEIPPVVTILLIAINVVVFVAELLQGEAFVTLSS